MAINHARLAGRLGAAVKVLNEVNATNSTVQSSAVAALQQYATQVLVQEVLADRSLTTQTPTAAFAEWTRQLAVAGDTFKSSTASTTVAAIGSPTGDPTWLASDMDAFGQRSDFLVPDVLIAQATGNSTLSIQGKAGVAASAPNWPTGAGVSTTLSLVDPSVTSSAQDPDFNQWSTSPPYTSTTWAIAAGTAGTTVSRATDGYYDAAGFCVQFTGDATALRVRQDVSRLSSGVYAVFAALKKGVFTVNTGTVTVTLRDSAGTLLSSTGISQAFSGLVAATWTPLAAAVYIPAQLPLGAYLEIQWTGGASDTLKFDCVSLVPLGTLYSAGLRVAGFMGVTDLVAGTDQWSFTTVMDGVAATSALVPGINRLLGIATASQRLTTTQSSPDYDDSLIA